MAAIPAGPGERIDQRSIAAGANVVHDGCN
jgi:hypothetical protein